MSAVCALPQAAIVAYAVRWCNLQETAPRNSKSPLEAGLCQIRSENRLIRCTISLPQSDRALQERFLQRSTCALPQAASGPGRRSSHA